jgi:hypothetical protein
VERPLQAARADQVSKVKSAGCEAGRLPPAVSSSNEHPGRADGPPDGSSSAWPDLGFRAAGSQVSLVC